MKLEVIGKIIASSFGDRVLAGVLTGALENVSPMRCYEYIQDNIQLLHQATDSDWNKYRQIAKNANIGNITSEDIMRELGKHRLDILGVIINHPEGKKWLQSQVDMLKEKLEIK